MIFAARLDAEVKANKASVVHACMYREKPFVSPKVGECARKVHGQIFHEKNFKLDRLQKGNNIRYAFPRALNEMYT